MTFQDAREGNSLLSWPCFFAFFFLIEFSCLGIIAGAQASIAQKKPSVKHQTVHHHKKYSKQRTLSRHIDRPRSTKTKKRVTKKPPLIQSQSQHHVPPPGHDGEERSDWFWQRRAWPNRTIDPQAYPTALAEAAKMPYYSPLAQHGESAAPLSAFAWQPIGPYSIDGSASAIATDPTDSNTFYIGAAAGGLWKTTDHGVNWRCVTDTFGSLSIGCITIDPTNTQTLYIGLGECNGSADSYPGDGLWKSTDGGNSWDSLGFGNAQYIAKILIDPRNHEQLFAAIPGPNSLSDTNRGVFRSTDGGATWTRSLFVRPSANLCIGFIDIAMNPFNSADLVAAGLHRSRFA